MTASSQNGVVTVTNTRHAVNVPVTVPPGTTVNGAGLRPALRRRPVRPGPRSAPAPPLTLTEQRRHPPSPAPPSADLHRGRAVQLHRDHHGRADPGDRPSPGTLPAGITFTDNGNGTATIAGTAAAGTGGSYPITIRATNRVAPPPRPSR